MKKIVSILMCIVCLACLFVGCKSVNNEPEITSSNTKTEKTLVWQDNITNVFKIEKCVLDANGFGFTIQLRNDTDKTIGTFSLILQYFDNNNKIVKEEVCHDDYPYQTKPGELTHDAGYYLKSNSKYVKVYVAYIDYNDGSRWINEDLVLSPESQIIIKMEKEVAGVYSIEKCEMDITKLKLQIKNLSPDKTIASYSVLVKYLEGLNDGFVFDYDDMRVKPAEVSEKAVWSVNPMYHRTASCYISEIVYSDGTKWNNPNIPAQESE